MNSLKKIIFIGIIYTLSLVSAQNNETNTSTYYPITETSTEITTIETTSTTHAPPLPTTTQIPKVIFNFTIPKDKTPVCLRAKFSLSMDIKYIGEIDNKTSNMSLPYKLESFDDYDGECNSTYNTLMIKFQKDWSIMLNYTLTNNIYQLDTIKLNYVVDKTLFVNAIDSELGPKEVEKMKLDDFSAGKDISYKCNSETSIELSEKVIVNFSNYHAQPFSASNKNDFDTAVECTNDLTGTSKLVPIIVGSALAVLVVLVLIAYIIGRRKHRPGYQQV